MSGTGNYGGNYGTYSRNVSAANAISSIESRAQSQSDHYDAIRAQDREYELRKQMQQRQINVDKYYEFEADMMQNVSQIIDKIRESEPTIHNYFMRSYNKEKKTEEDVRKKVNNCVKFTNLLLDLIKLVINPTNNCDNILKVTLLNNKIDRKYNTKISSDIPKSALELYHTEYTDNVDILHLVYAGDKDSTTQKLDMTVSKFYKNIESYLLHGKKININAIQNGSELIEGLILFFLGLVYTRAFINGYTIASSDNIDFYETMLNTGGLRGNKADSLLSIINSKNKTFTQRVLNKFINPKQPELSLIKQLINTIKESYASFALYILNLQYTFSSANAVYLLNNMQNWDNIKNFRTVFIRHDEFIIRDRSYYTDNNYREQAKDDNPSSTDLSDRIMPIMKSIEEPTRNIISMCREEISVDTTSSLDNNNSSVNGGKSRRRRRLSKRKTIHGRKTGSKRRSRK